MVPHLPKDPGHTHANTAHITFQFFDQENSPATFGYEYFISLPPTYTDSPDKRWPLVLFLHGAGESQRSSGESYTTLRHGIPKIILAYDKLKSGQGTTVETPLAPRFEGRNPNKGKTNAVDLASMPVNEEVAALVAENFITVTPSLDLSRGGYGWNATVLAALLDEIEALYRVDPSRIHVTGFSMGGYGTWSLALQCPDRFASLVPICGGADKIRVKILKHVPHWVHHGQLDDIIPLRASQEIVSALQKARDESRAIPDSEKKPSDVLGADDSDLQFTIYPDATHDCWTVTYENIEVWKWMLAKRIA